MGTHVLQAEAAPMRSLLYTAAVSGRAEIFVSQGDGGSATQLTNDAAYHSWWPKWSPDGNRIMFMRVPVALSNWDSDYTQTTIWTMNADGTNLQCIVGTPSPYASAGKVLSGTGSTSWAAGNPNWISNGNFFVMFAGLPGSQHVYTIRDDGTEATQLVFTLNGTPVSGFTDIQASPDGTTLVMCLGGNVVLGPIGGGDLVLVTADGATTPHTDPAWSPDGSTLYYSSYPPYSLTAPVASSAATSVTLTVTPNSNQWAAGDTVTLLGGVASTVLTVLSVVGAVVTFTTAVGANAVGANKAMNNTRFLFWASMEASTPSLLPSRRWIVNDGNINSKPSPGLDGMIYFHRLQFGTDSAYSLARISTDAVSGTPRRITPVSTTRHGYPDANISGVIPAGRSGWPHVQGVGAAASTVVRPRIGKKILITVTLGVHVEVIPSGWVDPGDTVMFVFTQDGTGHAVTWDASWAGVSSQTVSTTPGQITSLEFVNCALSVGATPVMLLTRVISSGTAAPTPLWNTFAATANVTLQSRDHLIANTTGGTFTVTLPAASRGSSIMVTNIGANAATISGGGANIDGSATLSLAGATTVMLTSDGTNWYGYAATPGAGVTSFNGATGAVTGARTPDVQVFTTTGAGTWTKPSNATTLQVTMVGGGGGGGSGGRQASGVASVGGSGGGGAGYASALFAATLFGATVAVSVGAGGTAGTSVTTDTTAGNAGGTGGNSTFGTVLKATGGVGGSGTTGGVGGFGGQPGTGGGASSATGAVGGTGTGSGTHGAAGGGAGGGVTTTPTANNGGAGGGQQSFATTTGTAGTTPGGAGGAGGSVASNLPGTGSGGGGGAGSSSGAGGTGGAGGTYGGGGGGGGASLNGNASGAGGAGGNGIIVVVSW
jgi:Tol biopolymer transport system component